MRRGEGGGAGHCGRLSADLRQDGPARFRSCTPPCPPRRRSQRSPSSMQPTHSGLGPRAARPDPVRPEPVRAGTRCEWDAGMRRGSGCRGPLAGFGNKPGIDPHTLRSAGGGSGIPGPGASEGACGMSGPGGNGDGVSGPGSGGCGVSDGTTAFKEMSSSRCTDMVSPLPLLLHPLGLSACLPAAAPSPAGPHCAGSGPGDGGRFSSSGVGAATDGGRCLSGR